MAFIPLPEDPRWLPFVERYASSCFRFAVEVLKLKPSLQQKELMDAVSAPGCRVSVASGHGCYAPGTRIRMQDGSTKAVEDVEFFDRLASRDGEARNVMKLYRGMDEMFRVTYDDGSTHTVNAPHELILFARGQEFRMTPRQFANLHPKLQGILKMRKTDGTEHAVTSVQSLGVGEFAGFSLDGDHSTIDDQGLLISNTGKSFSLSIIIPWLLFTHYKAWVLVTANDIDQIKASTLKEIASQIGRLKEGPYAWLADKIELMASGDLRVRGYEQNWLMELKTANAKNANKMAGRHAKFLTIIADEGSSIPDTVMMTLNGALTEAANRFIITSQPTKNSGFFYDTFNRLSERNGGHWHNITMSSIDSPHVSDESLKTLWAMYDDDERRVRILGLFPQDSARFFVGRKAVENAYKRGRIINANEHYGYFICCDIASGEGLRDKSAVSVCRVYGYGDERRVEVVDIPLFTNNIRSNQFAHYIIEAAAPYPNVTFVVDSGGLGINVCQDLEDAGKMVQRVNWGNPCFRNVNKDRYLNLRAQATHQLARAIKEGRFSVLTNDHRAVGLDQVSRIPKTFTDKGRLRVPPKHGPEWEGMGSPDLADTWAFAFLETSTYTASGESVSDKTMISAAEAATEEAANLFSDL